MRIKTAPTARGGVKLKLSDFFEKFLGVDIGKSCKPISTL